MTANRPQSETRSPTDAEQAVAEPTQSDVAGDESEPSVAAARAELLVEENRRLRAQYTRAQQAKYRRTAYALGAIGLVAVLGGGIFPAVRELLITFGAIGLFGAVLTRYLTPGQFLSAEVGERVYTALAANQAAIADELGLSETRVYAPTDENARLYRPQRTSNEPPGESSRSIVVADEHRGLWLTPTGAPLYELFTQRVTGEPADTPVLLADQLADALVEQFELATTVETDVTDTGRHVTFAVTGATFGDLDRADHPIVSLVATGLATQLATPVTVTVTQNDDGWLVTCALNNK